MGEYHPYGFHSAELGQLGIGILQAIGTITATDIGRAALKDDLKSMVILYDEQTAPSSNYRDGVSVKDGVLTMNWKPLTNVGDVEPRAMALIDALESAL